MPSPREFVVEHVKRGSAFLIVGGLAFVVDAAVFNLLVHVPERGVLFDAPILAKVVSIVMASVVTYIGNRMLTYRDRGARLTLRRLGAFVAINGIAILLQLACLGFSRYVIGLTDPIADNVSGTLIGQGVATVVRYLGYGRWVFPDDPERAEHAVESGP